MARETKEERVVRSMQDQMTEHLHELKALAGNPATKELDVERWCQSLLRSCLGFTATNGYTIRAQETRGKSRPDLIILKGDQPVCVVEVKKLGFDLNKSDLRSGKIQLAEYLHSLPSVRWGILTSGYEWKLFDFSVAGTTGVEISSFDLRNDTDQIELDKKSVEDTCWNFVDFHEVGFSSDTWTEFSREATAFSPESLAKAMLSLDVIKLVARVIRGEHDYKANTEVLIEKVLSLLTEGLDDSIAGWNEAKEVELKKFVTAQKRAGRRKRSRSDNKSKTPTSESASQHIEGEAQTTTEANVTSSSDPEKQIA